MLIHHYLKQPILFIILNIQGPERNHRRPQRHASVPQRYAQEDNTRLPAQEEETHWDPPESESGVSSPIHDIHKIPARKTLTAPQLVPPPAPDNNLNTASKLPLYRGKKFELLSPGELKDTMSHCLYCSRKLCNPSTRFSHLLSQHHQEHYR